MNYFASSLLGKPSWNELDPQLEYSYLNHLNSSNIAHKRTQKVGRALNLKTRVVKKLCDLAGSGSAKDTQDFILRRLPIPTWFNVEEFISHLPSISEKSSLRSVAIRLALSLSAKVSTDV